MARRILQFPVRNAFAPRAQDALARDTQGRAHRIVERVENELGRQAERMGAGNNAELERARSYGVFMMPRVSRPGNLRMRIRAFRSSLGAFASSLISRPKPQQ